LIFLFRNPNSKIRIEYITASEGEKNVPKLKTNRGAAKRFKKTGTGKIKGKRAFARHILTKKSANRKRGLRTPKIVAKRDTKGIKMLLPYI